MGPVDLREVALAQQVVEVEDVVLDLFAGDLLTQLLTHPRPFADNLIITYIIQQTHLASRQDSPGTPVLWGNRPYGKVISIVDSYWLGHSNSKYSEIIKRIYYSNDMITFFI